MDRRGLFRMAAQLGAGIGAFSLFGCGGATTAPTTTTNPATPTTPTTGGGACSRVPEETQFPINPQRATPKGTEF